MFSQIDNNLESLFDDTKIICYKNCKCCNNIDFISKNIIINKCWEPNITSLFLNLLKDKNDAVVFDIGCNIGYYSLVSSKYCSKIYSFDANINNITMLNQSIQINNFDNIETICCAITNDESELYKTGIIHEHNVGSLQIVKVSQSNESNITSIKLDNFIKKYNIDKIDIMKIDVEGSELTCLKGLEQTLEKDIIKNIIIEITPLWDISIAKQILLYLNSKGYAIFDMGLNETGNYSDNYYNFQDIFNNPIINIDSFIENTKIQTNILAKKHK